MATEKISRFSLIERPQDDGEEKPPRVGHIPPRSHLPRVGFRLEERRQIRGLLSIVYAVSLSWLARFTVPPVRRLIAKYGGYLSYRLSTEYRENVIANLHQVLGASASDKQIDEITRKVFENSGLNSVDMLMVPHMSPKQIVDQVQLQVGSWDYLDEAFKMGKGVVIVTGHLGAFDFVGQALHLRGYKLTSLTGRTTSRFLFDAVTFLRRSHQMRLVEASPSGMRTMYRALQRGEGAVFVIDRDFFLNGREVELFGRRTTLSQGAVRIARDTGAAIVPIFGTRTKRGHALRIEPPFHVEKTEDREADIARGLDKIVPILERVISATPEQWVMFQPVWPSEPVDRTD